MNGNLIKITIKLAIFGIFAVLFLIACDNFDLSNPLVSISTPDGGTGGNTPTPNPTGGGAVPAVPSQPDLDPACDTGLCNFDDNTNQSSNLRIYGTSDPGVTIEVFINSVVNTTLSSDAAGNWSGYFAMGGGTHTICARASNVNGSSGYSAVLMMTVDVTPPAAPGLPTAGAASTTTIPLSWSVASDTQNDVSLLEYSIRYATSPGLMTSPEFCELYGTLGMPYTANVTNFIVSGLTPACTYYFAVIVRDRAGNRAMYALRSASTM
jgi:hypothetical protein